MNGDQEDPRGFAGMTDQAAEDAVQANIVRQYADAPEKKYETMVFEGNPDGIPLAQGMNINVAGKPLMGVKSFTITGKAGELIEATVVLEANILGLVAEGKLEGDAEDARRILEEIAGPITAYDLSAAIGQATGEYPEWDAGEEGVIEKYLARHLAAKAAAKMIVKEIVG